MMITSVARSFRRKGYTIIRYADRSGWLLVSPCGRYRSQFWTRADAMAAADLGAAKIAQPWQLGLGSVQHCA